MEQQAELALADLPVAPASLRAVAALHVPTIRPPFPAVHHLQADRSAVGRAVALWAAARRAADLGRPHMAARRWARRWTRRTTGPWSQAAVLTGPEAIIPVDRFVAYLEEAERAFPDETPADLLSRIRNTYYSGFLVSQLL
ncbi:MAG: hypothetical protein ACJ745_04065, partial [Actinomycetes bacterium]